MKNQRGYGVSKYAREVSSKIREKFSHNAGQVRSNFLRQGETKESEEIRQKQLKKQYLVKGRQQDGVLIWDVYELDGFSKPKLSGTGFAFQEEAIAFARDRSLGRMSVGYGKIKGLFKPGKGGVLVPGGNIDLPNQGRGNVSIVHTKKGIIVG